MAGLVSWRFGLRRQAYCPLCLVVEKFKMKSSAYILKRNLMAVKFGGVVFEIMEFFTEINQLPATVNTCLDHPYTFLVRQFTKSVMPSRRPLRRSIIESIYSYMR